MTDVLSNEPASGASYVLGRKLDSIPFSSYHVLIIAVLALVGFIEGYDLVMTGSLLVLARAPLKLTDTDIRLLAVGPTFMLCIGGFIASAISDHWSRKTIMLIGVVATTFLTLLIPLVQNAEQLILIRLLTGLGAGGAVSAAFPIATELMPAQHRRTYGAIYEMSLAASFTVVPFIGGMLAGNANAFRFLALPGGLSITVVPVLIWYVLPESPRWHLRRGHPQAAIDIVNGIIRRAGDRVPPLNLRELGDTTRAAAARLPSYWALFAKGQRRWTTVGILSGICAGTAYFLISVLLPKALNDQGFAVQASLSLTSIVYAASFFGKGFTGFLMEIIGRRWTIAYALTGSLPGLALMLLAHRAGEYAGLAMTAGGMIMGFTVLSAFTATRIYLAEQFPTELRGRGHIFGESFGRLFAGGLAPFLMEPHTGSAVIFFGTIIVIVSIGAFIPLLFGRETVGQLEVVTAPVPQAA
ncbi:MAG TPA: MFS transporter [Stellaceae bacterium]|jgi:putative MFS transporter|nr:MFS transporter [Stellaceae bacterium]